MTAARPVVVDTMAVSALVNEQRDPDTARRYRQLVADRSVLVSFVTVGEMRYGAIKAGWGELRTRGLERALSQVVVVQPDDELIRTCAALRAGCERGGHALARRSTRPTAGSPPPQCVSDSSSSQTTPCSRESTG